MSKAIRLTVASKYKKNFQSGYPLVTEESVQRLPKGIEEGAMIELVDENYRFIGKGYYGKQNKGRGWVLTRNQQEPLDETFFAKKIKTAFERRAALFSDPDTTAFRVFNGEGDGIGGITIDYYDGFYVISWYSEGVYTFKKTVVEALMKTADVKGLYEKKRFAVKGTYMEDDDFVAGERASFPLMVKENGINYPIYLNEGAMVGVFLDQRHVRKTIRDKYAEGKTVLNTFSYTGAFSVAAALGGASKTTSVDLANRSKSKTIEMFSVNGIDYEAQDIIVEDVFNYFKYAVRKQLKFDMVILDPPSFARSKKHTFSARKDYPELLEQAIQITEKNGIIVASSNCSTFNMKKFKDFIKKAFGQTGDRYKILEEFTLPEDFRTIKEFKEGDYLKVAFIQKL
ncbi:class I SAM-dependent rRNA methyltransferase [Bacillus sp. ISL-47]|uniref:class I SAM-dependent rRNA methyltransferase n=1 Tax=Bacillus sp. ISL-47 TaxID=2819130 RepID=UPI001BEB22E5|nr:class I SAM-dependent rRNA methyltransferase [Bacillus sp. ISL-47]MBT2690206.1 class I SAM-dependent rRNA methyltransferase [Bacillus sp. ISL-47]MBT2710345.1 class I SAM-dependent rRNA methyltransferase [Pseudomonas sp. ISL-84]